jgi:hypothetical protein
MEKKLKAKGNAGWLLSLKPGPGTSKSQQASRFLPTDLNYAQGLQVMEDPESRNKVSLAFSLQPLLILAA